MKGKMTGDVCPHCGSDEIYEPNPRLSDGIPYCDNCGENIIIFSHYRRKGLAEMRPYIKGEDLSNVSVSKEDDPEKDMGMIARNPLNHKDQWYVARQYFYDNFEPVNP